MHNIHVFHLSVLQHNPPSTCQLSGLSYNTFLIGILQLLPFQSILTFGAMSAMSNTCWGFRDFPFCICQEKYFCNRQPIQRWQTHLNLNVKVFVSFFSSSTLCLQDLAKEVNKKTPTERQNRTKPQM